MNAIKEEVFFNISGDGKKIYNITSNYEKIWGRSCDSLSKQPNSWLEAVHPEEREKVTAAWDKLLTTGTKLQEKYRIIKSDLSIGWIWTRSFPMKESEKITGFAIISSEIDLEKECWKSIAEITGDGIWEWDLKSDRVFLSSLSQQLRGEAKLATSQTSDEWWQQIHPEDLKGVIAALEKHLKELKPFAVTYRIECKNGDYKWILNRGTVEKNENQKIVRIVGIESDISERKKIEQELQKSEQKYRNIIETMQEGVGILDLESKYIFVNQQLADILGCTVAELTGKDAFDFVREEDKLTIKQKVANRRRGIKEHYDFSFIRQDGSEWWAIVSASPILDENGKFSGTLLVFTDITQRKKAEQALQKSEQKYRTIIETMNEGVAILNRESKYTFANQQLANILGCTVAELQGKDAFDFVRAEDRIEMKKRALARRQGIKERYDFRFCRKDGSEWWAMVSANPLLDENGQYSHTLITFTDISDRKKIEENLQKSEQKYRNIIETMIEGLAILDENGKCTFANPQLVKMFGYTSEELLGMESLDIIDRSEQAEMLRNRSIHRQGIKQQYDFQFIRKDGSKMWAMVSANPLLDKNGKYTGTIATFNDITDRKIAERQVAKTETFLQTLIYHLPLALFVKDTAGQYITVNRSCEQLFGCQEKEIIGKTDYDFFLKEEADSFRAKDREVCTSRNKIEIPTEIVNTPNIGRRVLRTIKVPLYNAEGQSQYVMGISEDITDRQEILFALQKSEEKYRRIIETISEGVWILDVDGKTTFANQQLADLFGYTRLQMLGKDLFDFIDEAEKIDAIAKLERCKRGIKETYNFRFRCKEGQDLWAIVATNPIIDRNGNYNGVLSTITDITARKQNEARLRLALEAGKIACWENNLQTNITTGYGCISNGWQGGEWQLPKERVFAESFLPEDRDTIARIIDRAIENNSEFAIEHRSSQYPNKWILMKGKIIGDSVVGISIDITQRKLAEIRSKQTEQFLQMLINYLPVALFVKDGRAESFGRLVLLNQNCEELFGVSTTKALGKTGTELFATPEAEFFERRDRYAFATGKKINIPPTAIESKNLGQRILTGIKVPLYDSQGKPEYLLCIAEDITDRHRARAALAESEARLAGILDNAEDGIISIDSDLRITMFNQGAEKLFDYKTAEIIGQPLEVLLSERYNPQHDRYISEFARAPEIAKKMGERSSVFARRRDGSEFPAEVSISKLELSGSTIFTAIVRDISARQLAEAALRRSEERFQLAVSGAGDGIWEWDLNGNSAYFSPKCKQILGYEDNEIENDRQNFFAYLHPDDRKLVKKALKNHWQKQIPLEIECRLRHKNGRYIWVYNTAQTIWDETGKPIRMAGSIRDITVRKLVEKNLREHEQFLENIFESATEIIWVVERSEDGDFFILTINKTVEDFTGIPPSEWIGKGLKDTYPDPEVAAKFQSNYEKCLEKNNSISFEHYCIYSEQERCFLITMSPLKNRSNSPEDTVRILGMAIDISDRKNAQEFLIELEKQRELSQMQLGFFSMASHEFRTPLSTILVIVQSLISYGDRFPREKIVKKLYQLEKVAKRMTEIIDNILKISRAEAGSLEIETKLLNPQKMCASIVKEIQINAGKDCEIIFISQGLNSLVQIDPKLFNYILTNLLTNAVKYSPSGRKVHLILKAQADKIVLIVQDKGIGIPKSDLPLLFQAFHRGKNVDKQQGSGLGLTVVKKCVDLHGGTIKVKSKYGKGTTFIVTIPTSK